MNPGRSGRPEAAGQPGGGAAGQPPAGSGHAPGGRGPAFWITAAAGWGLIAVGVWGVLSQRIDTRPADLARFVVGGALLHDLVVAPATIAAAWLVGRLARGRARAPVQAALVVSAALAVYSYPLVRGFGRAAGNPTSLPHDYTNNLAVVLAALWLATAVVVAWRLAGPPWRGARARRSEVVGTDHLDRRDGVAGDACSPGV